MSYHFFAAFFSNSGRERREAVVVIFEVASLALRNTLQKTGRQFGV
jgi:hypothetical protein